MSKMKLTFSDGSTTTTYLSQQEVTEKLNLLDCIIAASSSSSSKVATSLNEKARAAYEKEEDFDGVVKLTYDERAFLKKYIASCESDADKELLSTVI